MLPVTFPRLSQGSFSLELKLYLENAILVSELCFFSSLIWIDEAVKVNSTKVRNTYICDMGLNYKLYDFLTVFVDRPALPHIHIQHLVLVNIIAN